MTGAQLAAARRAAGLSQVALARAAGVGRHAVQYWEAKPTLDRRGYAVRRFLKALALPDIPHHYARAGGSGVSPFAAIDAFCEARLAADLARLAVREAQRAATRRVSCGARTRKGKACRNKSEPGKRRCKFHGGKSTGPRTAEGRARIAEAQRRRWARMRQNAKEC